MYNQRGTTVRVWPCDAYETVKYEICTSLLASEKGIEKNIFWVVVQPRRRERDCSYTRSFTIAECCKDSVSHAHTTQYTSRWGYDRVVNGQNSRVLIVEQAPLQSSTLTRYISTSAYIFHHPNLHQRVALADACNVYPSSV